LKHFSAMREIPSYTPLPLCSFSAISKFLREFFWELCSVVLEFNHEL
jgi:hypothetical protein